MLVEGPESDDPLAVHLCTSVREAQAPASPHVHLKPAPHEHVDWKRAVLLVVKRVNKLFWNRVGVMVCHPKIFTMEQGVKDFLNSVRPEGGWELRTLTVI